MKKALVCSFMALAVLLAAACDSLLTEPGSFVVVFQWETGHEPDTAAKDYYIWAYYQEWKGGEGKEFPADIETNAKSLDEAGPVKLGSGENLNFTKLTYGDNRFVRAAVWDNAERTGDPLYIGISELFDFSADDRNKAVAVNMKLQANAGVDETGEAGSFAIEVRYDGVPADRVPAATVTLRFTVKNADTIIIANDLNFEKGPVTLKLTELTQIDDTTYEYGPWDITTGWEGLGDTTYSVFGKSRNTLGYESAPQRADVYLDTTAPTPNVTPFPTVAKLGDTITVRFSFDEEVLPEDLELNWRWLEFTLVENNANKSYIFSHAVTEQDPESTADFTLRATDAVGNVTDHLPLGVVTIDRTPPQTGAMTVTKNGVEVMPSSNLYLKDGDELALSIAFSETLGADPLIRLGMHELPCTKGNDDVYDCSLTIDKNVHGDTIADLTVSFEDVAGNGTVYTAMTLVRIDSQPPQITFQKNKPTGDYNATEQIVYTLTTNEALATLTVDGVTQYADKVSWTFTGENITGDHQVMVIATDLAGNVHPEAAIGTYRVDADYPTADITAPTPDRVKGDAAVTFTVTKSGAENLASIKVRNHDGSFSDCVAGTCSYTTATGTIGTDTTETVTVQYADAVGNAVSATAGTVYVDRTNPTLTVTTNKNSYNASDQLIITVNASEELAVDPTVTLDGNLLTGTKEGNSWVYTPALTDGAHTVAAVATDLVGNTTDPAGTKNYTADVTDPTATIGLPTPARIAGGSTTTITLSNITEPLVVTLNGDAALCEKNGDDYECTYTAAPGTGDKVETLTVTYADAAGNDVTETAGTVYVDRTNPTLTAQIVPGDKTLNASEMLQITVNASEELSGNPTVALLDSDNNPVAPSDTETQGLSFIYTYPTLADDTYHLTVNGSDAVGHAAAPLSITDIVSDSSIPAISNTVSVMPSRIKPGDDTTISFVATEPMNDPGDSVVVKVGTVFANCTSGDGLAYECTYTGTAGASDSIETISIALTDASANGTTNSGGTIYVDRTAPQMVSRLVTPAAAKNGATVQVLVIFDEPVSLVSFGGDGLLFTRTDDLSDPQRFTYEYPVKGTETERSYALTLAANDVAGNPVADTSVGSFTIDRTTPAIAELHVCRDDATDDPCAADETTFSAVAGYREMKISFSLSEAADTLAVELGDTDITGGNCTAFAGPSYVCTATVIDTAAGANPRMESDLAKVTTSDAAGNGDFDSKSLLYDFLPPAVTGTAFFSFTPPAGCPLATAQVTEVTNGTAIRAQFAVSEPLDGAQADEVTALRGAQEISFAYNAVESGAYVMVYTAAVSGMTDEGEHTFTVALTDTVGNEATVTPAVSPALSLDVAAPDAPDVMTAGKVVYRRIPWGSNATGGSKYFSITAGSDTVDGDTVAAVAYEMGAAPTPEQSVKIGMATVVGRTFPEMRLDGSDRTQVHLVAYDAACNHSSMIRVNDIEWTATMGYKLPASTIENPHLFTKTPRWLPGLTQDPAIVREATQAEYGSLAWIGGDHVTRAAEQVWTEFTGDGVTPTARLDHAMVYDSGRGTVVMFGGYLTSGTTDELWEYDGATGRWTDRTPIVGPGPRAYHTMVYDSARGTVVMFGGSNAGPVINDIWEWDGNAGTWTDRTPVPYPVGLIGRQRPAAAYDSIRGKVVLFGGLSGLVKQDLWEWDGNEGTWTERHPVNPPPARWNHRMIFDSARSVVMVFGGADAVFDPVTYFDDIWEYDGGAGDEGAWINRTTTDPRPEGRENHALIYDRTHEKIVLYGGSSNGYSTYYDDLWEWVWDDDLQKGIWTERTLAAPYPDTVKEHAMACDEVRGTVLLFGGRDSSNYLQVTWEWDGDAGLWTDRTPSAVKPPARFLDALAYDSDRGKVVLFGGGGSSYMNDTWERDQNGGVWTEQTPAGDRPPIRGGHTLAYDGERKVTVLFGGYSSGVGPMQDTWEWDGTAWTKRTDPTDCTGYSNCTVCTATTCPSVRWLHGMVYDASRGRVVVFGGYDSDSAIKHKNDIWEWDGTAGVWTDRTPAEGDVPDGRMSFGMAYDSDRGKVMIYGGSSTVYCSDLWEWDGDGGTSGEGTWFKYTLVGSGPGSKNRHVMTYDTVRRKTILYGGQEGQHDIWEWDAATNHWEERTPSGIDPVGREYSAMIYDTVRERALIFGGRERSVPMDDTWEWDGSVAGRPAEICAIRFASAQATGEELVSLTVNFIAGGSAYSAPGEDGANLWVWDSHPGAWRLLDSNAAAAGGPEFLSWTTDDPAEVARLLFGSQQSVTLAVAPLHPNGTATQLSEVAVDYAEVVVRYRIP